jgi:hypothetical protein
MPADKAVRTAAGAALTIIGMPCVAMAHAEKRVGVARMKVQYRAKDA